MIFGDKEFFAVQLELDEEPCGAWLFGHFCYWISGVRVGDYELSTSLRDVLSGMKWIIHDRGRRLGGVLCELTPPEIYSRLNNALYGGEEVAGANAPQLPEEPARFEITVPVEVFNDWKAFLVECGGEAFVLCKNLGTGDLRASVIRPGAFDEAVDKAYRHLDELHQRAVSEERLRFSTESEAKDPKWE